MFSEFVQQIIDIMSQLGVEEGSEIVTALKTFFDIGWAVFGALFTGIFAVFKAKRDVAKHRTDIEESIARIKQLELNNDIDKDLKLVTIESQKVELEIKKVELETKKAELEIKKKAAQLDEERKRVEIDSAKEDLKKKKAQSFYNASNAQEENKANKLDNKIKEKSLRDTDRHNP